MLPSLSWDGREPLLIAETLRRILILAAHPDDETIACSGLLQRADVALVVFAVDGAPPHYGFEKKFGSLHTYSATRFEEASRALNHIPHCSMRRLTRKDGTWFQDQHLFLELAGAFASLLQIIREFSPNLLVSHAFEGGHVDHDACHVLSHEAARAFALPALEFPVYWRSQDGADVLQRFREKCEGEFTLPLVDEEIALKQRMICEYQTQKSLLPVFHSELERFRPIGKIVADRPAWPKYPFENRRRALKTTTFLKKVAEFYEMSRVNEFHEGDIH